MSTEFTEHIDHELNEVRAGLAEKTGPEYWRSLEELSQTEAFQEYIHNEFPDQAAAPLDGVTRRNFLQVMGATLALAGATTGCARQPEERIVPYVKPPEEVIPGKALYFASAAVIGGYARGVLVETHMGRPVKLEGLPNHPSSLGGCDAQTQATILDMYDPDRSSAVKSRGRVSTRDLFLGEIHDSLNNLRPNGGEGITLLTGAVTSPTQTAMIEAFLAKNPKAKWRQWEPAGLSNAHEGAKLIFGQYVDTVYDFTKADVILSLDSDFLTMGPGSVRYARDFASRRDVEDLGGGSHGDGHGEEASADEHHAMKALNRMYAVESLPTTTGASADHRFPVKPSEVEAIARGIARRVGGVEGGADPVPESQVRWVDAIANDLKANAGHSVVVVGDHQPPVVHALAHAINNALKNTGETVTYVDPVQANIQDNLAAITELTEELNAGSVELLIVHGTNPVYTAPADLDFAAAFDKAGIRVHLGRYEDETAELCHWHVPESHDIESWGDARGHDGTASIIQPTILPLYTGTLSGIEFLSLLTDEEPRAGYDIVRDFWKTQNKQGDFETFWRVALADGTVANSYSWDVDVRPKGNPFGAYAPVEVEGMEVTFQADPAVLDGSFSNNAWMQELPKPLSKLTWDNAVILAHATAEREGIENEDLVEVTIGERTIKGPVWIQPGHAKETIGLHLGYGRTQAGKVAEGAGFDAYALRTTDGLGFARGASIRKLGGKFKLARTEEHYNMEGRHLVRHVTQASYEDDYHVVHEGAHAPKLEDTMLPDVESKQWHGYAWGMTFDLNKCTGCNACITACQSENLIPSVGKQEVINGREMHWIRVDRYYSTGQTGYGFAHVHDDGPDNPKTFLQPVPCMQCENALCELVCPVAATQHTKEGLNDMVYNRCIGTRYCSNNCPYKVRRFNFYNYSRTPRGRETGEVYPETLKPMRNPDVTLRTRGVMEKCTYCVQRINLARIDAKREDRLIHDGEIATACQQACPSAAISFGNINDHDSEVARLKTSHRNYGLLEDLNTRPRTTYLARLTNPNPELEA